MSLINREVYQRRYHCKANVTKQLLFSLSLPAIQAPELTATVGQAFELAYKKFLEGEKARKEFEQLKQTYHTASPEEKEKIRVQLEEGRKQRAIEASAAREKALNVKGDNVFLWGVEIVMYMHGYQSGD